MRKKFLSLLLVLSMLLAIMPIMAAADTPITQTTATITKAETDTTYNFDITPEVAYANCYVYAAIYDVNGALLEVKRVPLETTDNTNISVEKSVYNASAKVFIWSDDMHPVIKAEEFTLTPTATLPPRPTATPTPQPTATPTPKPTAIPTPTPKPPSNVTWSLDEITGTLTISGTGDMEDYSSSSSPFYNNSNIKSVVIENGVTSIGNYTFYKCSGITSITIPNSVTSIGNYAFNGCNNLTDIYYNDNFIDFTQITIGLGVIHTMSGGELGNNRFIHSNLHCDDMVLDKWGKCGDTVAYYLNDNGTLTISGTGDMTNYEKYDGSDECFARGLRWYSERGNIKSVVIEKGVTSIGNYVFENCNGLTSITIPDSVTSIGSLAFYGCSGLTSVTIPDSVTSIDSSAFYGCSGLISVTIGNSVTSIGSSAFYGCSGLTNITIGNSVTNIGSNAFGNCSRLTSVTIPDSVTSIGDYAFYNCNKLDSVYITDLAAYLNINFSSYYDSNPMHYANKLYLNGKRVAGKITIPDGVAKIPMFAFEELDSITSVTIPDSVTSIGCFAFCDCSGLTSISIGNSVTSIDRNAFYGCRSLTSISIGNSVTSIGEGAFNGCSGLKDVYITDLAAWCNIKFDSIPMSYADNLYLNNELVTNLVIPDNVTSIGNYTFYNCSSLTDITIPDSVTSIGDSAFKYCSGLTSITIPDSVTSIGYGVFYHCSGLTSITIPDSITSIGDSAFSGCSGLTSITIPDSVMSIGDNAFDGCSGLTSVTIGNGITNIDNQFNLKSLTEIVIPKSVTEIENGAFNNCSNLTTVKYCGSEAEWNEMYIGSNNDYLKNTNIVFDYVKE